MEQDHISQLSELAAKTESAIVHNADESESHPSPARFANSCSGYARRCHRRAAGLLGRRAQQKGSGVGIFGALTGILFGDVTLTQESELAAAGQAAKQGERRERSTSKSSAPADSLAPPSTSNANSTSGTNSTLCLFEFDANSCPRPQSAFYRLSAHTYSTRRMQPGPLTVRALRWRAELVRTSLGTFVLCGS